MFIKLLHYKTFPFFFLLSFLNPFNSFSQSVWIPFKENDSWGIKDEKNQVIFNPEFDSIYFDHPLYQHFNDQIVIIKNGKLGIANLKSKFTVEPTFDKIFVNGGMDLGNNSTEEIQTASGFFHVGYNRISKYTSKTSPPFHHYELYFIILKSNNEYFILNNRFLRLLPDPVDDILINPEIYNEYGILILEYHAKAAILYNFGKKCTGFIFNSASFLLNEEPYFYNEKTIRLFIDNKIVWFKNNGRIIESEADLIIPEYEFSITGKQDTRSWIYDYTLSNKNILISDGESNLYSFSDQKKCNWIIKVPDLFQYKPVFSDQYISAGNYVIKLEADTVLTVPLPGKNLRCLQLKDNFLFYIGDFDQSDIPDRTEISGWHDIIEASGPSPARLICYDLKNEVITWNRHLPASSSLDLQIATQEQQLVFSITLSHPFPETLVLMINKADGSEIKRQDFVHPQKIFNTEHEIYLSDQCDPDYDLNCENLSVRIFDSKKNRFVDTKMKIDYPDNLYISNEYIFYLGDDNELEIRDIESFKKKKNIALKWLHDFSENPTEETQILQYTDNKLYFLTANQYLFSLDPRTSEIKSYGFYKDDYWIKIYEKKPAISDKSIAVIDEFGDLHIFKLF